MLDALPPGHEIAWAGGEYVARPKPRGGSVLGTYEPIIPDPRAVLPDPFEASLRAAGRGVESAAMLPVALGKVLYGAATRPSRPPSASGAASGRKLRPLREASLGDWLAASLLLGLGHCRGPFWALWVGKGCNSARNS